ncbi:MAG: hypothetical protein WCY58_11320 [Mariniphaga sp.]|nr:hypothetical protein [Mariniphaga sp.]
MISHLTIAWPLPMVNQIQYIAHVMLVKQQQKPFMMNVDGVAHVQLKELLKLEMEHVVV